MISPASLTRLDVGTSLPDDIEIANMILVMLQQRVQNAQRCTIQTGSCTTAGRVAVTPHNIDIYRSRPLLRDTGSALRPQTSGNTHIWP